MTKRNHDLLRDLLDELCVTPIYTAACARCGISTKTLWRYIRVAAGELALLPCPCRLPQMAGGSASALSLSRPA